MLPALLFYGFVMVIPTIQGSVYAFTDWDGLSSTFNFVGFDNIVAVLTTPSSLTAVINTVIIAVAFTVIQNIIGLALAIGVNSRIKSGNFLKVIFFMPAIITPLVVAYLWKYMLAPTGVVNSILAAVGLQDLQQSWLGTPEWALASIIGALIWQFVGYAMVIYLAGLQGVPAELMEAAAVDGAGKWRTFRSIVLPLLAPAITINLMLSMIGGLKVFDQVFAMTGGGPGGATNTLSTLLFKEAFSYGNFGGGVAMALILTVLVSVIAIAQYRGLARREVKN